MPKTFIIEMSNLDLFKEDDVLKFAYSLLKLQDCKPEVSIMRHDSVGISDLYAVTYRRADEVTFEEFCKKYNEHKKALMAVIATDNTDKHRITFTVLPSEIISTVNSHAKKEGILDVEMPLVMTAVLDSVAEKELPNIFERLDNIVARSNF